MVAMSTPMSHCYSFTQLGHISPPHIPPVDRKGGDTVHRVQDVKQYDPQKIQDHLSIDHLTPPTVKICKSFKQK